MDSSIENFISYMSAVKKASNNTVQSYRRDLKGMSIYFKENGIDEISRVNGTNINSYILFLEKQGKSAATIARNVSAIKTFFRFLINNGQIKREPTENLRTPQNEKKRTEAITAEDMEKIVSKLSVCGNKDIRDNAMLRLMMDTGIKVSELIELKVNDVNTKYSFVTCRGKKKDKTVPLGTNALEALKIYISTSRESFVKDKQVDYLFLNCYGNKMSRQGFWKMFKDYARLAGVESVTTYSIHK